MKPDLLPVSSCANRLAVVSFGLAMLGFSAQPAHATLWTGSANDQNWATAGNWDPFNDGGSTPPADGNSIWLNSSATLANHPIFTAAQGTLSVKDIYMYGNPGSHLDQTGGSLTTTGYFGMATDPGSSATFNLSDGTFASTGDFFVGEDGTGIVNQTGGTVNVGNWLVASRWNGSNGTYNLSSGTVNVTGNAVGVSYGGGTANINVSGGNFNCNDVWVSECYNGTAGTGTLTISGTGTVNPTWWVWITKNAAATGVVNLDGGTLATTHVVQGSGSATLNFNGGTLKAKANDTNFIEGTVALNVKSGGAVIDTNNCNITIQNALAADTGSTGGLTKNGTGTLTLTGANTFTGGIGIAAGTLKIGGSGSLGSGTYAGAISNAGMLHVGTSADQTLSGGISGSGSLAKDGTGTLTLSGGGTLKSGISLYGGAFAAVLKESTTRITSGTYDASGTEWVVGGLDTGNGTNTHLVMGNASALTNISWLSIGRGNGNGTALSDVTLNDTASITANSMSAGYNVNNTATKPKGTITLNGSSSLTVSDYFHLAESAGSSMTLTLNDTAAVTLAGTPDGEDRRNLGLNGSGVLTLNAGTTFTDESTRWLNVGYQNGSGVVNINGGTFNKSSGELRVGTTSTNGVYTATGTINMTGGTATVGSLTLGRGNNNDAKVNGTLNVSGGTLTVTTGLAIVGYQGDGTAGGTLNITGGTFDASGLSGTNSMLIGTGGSGRGTVTVNGGTLNSLNDMVLAENYSSSGSVALTSGTINLGTANERWLKMNGGSGGNATFTVDGGTLNLNYDSDLRFTTAAGATGTNTFTLNGGLVQGQTGNQNGVASANTLVDMNNAATGAPTNTFNLNGGTLTVGQVITSNNSGTVAFNFHGGTLKAAGGSTAFLDLGGEAQTANVLEKGAFIDSNGYNVTVVEPLLHGGEAATDGGLTKNGAGTLTLGAVNDYNGGTTLNAGILAVGGTVEVNNGALGSGTVAVNSGAQLRVGASVTSNQKVATIANNITLAGGTIYADDAFQHLSGSLNVTAASTLGATYNAGNNNAWERDKGLFLDGVVAGSGDLTLQHSGIATGNYWNSSIVHFNNAANTYSGRVTVVPMAGSNGGSYLGLNASTALQYATVDLVGNNTGSTFGTSPLVFKSGIGSATLGALSGSGNVVLTGYDQINHGYGSDPVALAVGSNDGSTTYSGIMSGGGSLTKNGAGTLTLTGASDYTGPTNVNAGTLVVNGSLADTAVTVANGAKLAGSGTIGTEANSGATVTVESGGIHAPGNSPGLQRINGSFTYETGSIFEWDLAANKDTNDGGERGTDYDAVDVKGNLTVQSGVIFKVIQNTGADFADAFWDSNQVWSDIWSMTGGNTNSAWSNTPVSVYDTGGTQVDVSTQGYFTMTGTTLNWTMVPELSNLLIGALLGAGMMRRKRKNV